MESNNRVVLIGNLGKDPEVRVLESGVKLVRFSLATNERFLDSSGEQRVHTEWHSVVAWRRVADYADRELRCGSHIRVEGKIRSRKQIDKRTGDEIPIFEIFADSLQLLSNDACAQSATAKNQPNKEPQILPPPQDVDNLPF